MHDSRDAIDVNEVGIEQGVRGDRHDERVLEKSDDLGDADRVHISSLPQVHMAGKLFIGRRNLELVSDESLERLGEVLGCIVLHGWVTPDKWQWTGNGPPE